MISLPKANKREVKRYGESLAQGGARCAVGNGLR